MRQTRDGKIHISKSGKKAIGVSFGYDHCAEQEIGLPFLGKFIDPQPRFGAKGRVWDHAPEDFVWVEYNNWSGFGYIENMDMASYMQRHACQFPDSEVSYMAWSDAGFLVLSNDAKSKRHLRSLFDNQNRLCFLPSGCLDGTGICIADSQMVTHHLRGLEEDDVAKNAEKEAWEASKAKAYLDDFRARCREQGVQCWYPCFLGPGRATSDNGNYRWWLNDSRPEHKSDYITDDEAIVYIKGLEKEFGVKAR